MSQEGNIWQALFSDYLFLVLTHVISVQQQLNSDAVHRLSLFHSAERSVEAWLHCETWWDELCVLRKKRLKRRPPVTQVQVWHTFFKPSTASSCNSGSRGTVPLSSCSVACVLSSFYPSIGTILFMPSFTPHFFTRLTQLLFWTSCEAPASLSSLSPLSFSLSAGACQSLLMTNSFAGALNSANFSLTLARSAPFSLFSGSSSNRASSSPPRKWVKQPQCKTSAVQQSSAACTASNSGSQELNMLTLEAL